ncbi:Cytochrome P450 [Apiospora sp. TS-2023a]
MAGAGQQLAQSGEKEPFDLKVAYNCFTTDVISGHAIAPDVIRLVSQLQRPHGLFDSVCLLIPLACSSGHFTNSAASVIDYFH